MKYLNKTTLSLALVTLMGYLCMNNTSGSHTWNGGRTNASFDNGNCGTGTGCHTGGSYNPTVTLQLLDGTTPVTTYTSNKNYTFRITITGTGTSSSTEYGMQGVCVQSSSNNNINNWGSMPTGSKTYTISGRTYISHSSPRPSNVFNIPWTSPATTTGNITFYSAGIVANGNNQYTGDNEAHSSLTITPAASGCTTPSVNTAVTDVNCYGDKTGTITVTTSGGSSPFSYDWTGPSSFSSSSKNLTGLEAGAYRLIVTATGGCKDTFNATVNGPAKFESNAVSNSPVCAGQTITLSALATGGNTGSYNYSWSGPGTAGSGSNTLNVTNAGAQNEGDFIITVRDAKNCTIIDTVKVEVDSIPTADGIIATKLSDNTYTYLIDNPRFVTSQMWLFGDGKTSTIADPNHTYTTKGTMTLKVVLTNNCGSDTIEKLLNVWPASIGSVHNNSEGVRVFPNPAGNYISISAVQGYNVKSIKLVALHGAIMYSQPTTSTQQAVIDVSQYASGIYILQVETDKGIQILPVSIRH